MMPIFLGAGQVKTGSGSPAGPETEPTGGAAWVQHRARFSGEVKFAALSRLKKDFCLGFVGERVGSGLAMKGSNLQYIQDNFRVAV